MAGIESKDPAAIRWKWKRRPCLYSLINVACCLVYSGYIGSSIPASAKSYAKRLLNEHLQVKWV